MVLLKHLVSSSGIKFHKAQYNQDKLVGLQYPYDNPIYFAPFPKSDAKEPSKMPCNPMNIHKLCGFISVKIPHVVKHRFPLETALSFLNPVIP